MTYSEIIIEAERQGKWVRGRKNPDMNSVWIVPPVRLKHSPTGSGMLVALVHKPRHGKQLKALATDLSRRYEDWKWYPAEDLVVHVFQLS